MKIWSIFLILMCLLLTSCKTVDIPPQHIILDNSIDESYKEFRRTKEISRNTLMFSNNFSANDCNTYLELIDHNEILETINNQLVRSEYLVCDALQILLESKRYSGRFDGDQIGLDLVSKLDVRSFPNSLGRLAAEHSFTLKALFPKESFSNKIEAGFESEDWVLTLKVVAIVKANSNIFQDWVVQYADESKSGNYRNYGTLIIYDPENSTFLKATVYQ